MQSFQKLALPLDWVIGDAVAVYCLLQAGIEEDLFSTTLESLDDEFSKSALLFRLRRLRVPEKVNWVFTANSITH